MSLLLLVPFDTVLNTPFQACLMGRIDQPEEHTTMSKTIDRTTSLIPLTPAERREKERKKSERRAKALEKLHRLDELNRMDSEEYVENWNPQDEIQKQALAELENNPNVIVESKKKVTPFNRTKVTPKQALTCGLCEGLEIRGLRFKTPCTRNSIGPNDSICSKFEPMPLKALNPNDLNREYHALQQFGDILTCFPSDKLALLLGIIWSEKRTRTFGFRFFQKVYYRWKGTSSDHYYDCFVIGYVISVNKDCIHLTTRTGSVSMYIYIDEDTEIFEGHGPTLYTEPEFEKLKPFMKGRKTPYVTKRSPDYLSSNETIRTIDDLEKLDKDSAETLPENTRVNKLRGKRNKVRDLVDIMGDLSKNFHKVSDGYYDDTDDSADVKPVKSSGSSDPDELSENTDVEITSLEDLRESEESYQDDE